MDVFEFVVQEKGDFANATRAGFPLDSLSKCSLSTLCAVTNVLLKVVSAKRNGHAKVSDVLIAEHIGRVGTAFAKWPLGLHEVCAQWQRRVSQRARPPSFQQHFAWAFVRLGKNLRKAQSQTQFIVREVVASGASTWDHGEIDRRVLQRWRPELPFGKFVDATTFARYHGVARRTVRRWIAAGWLKGRSFRGRGSRTKFLVEFAPGAKVRHLLRVRTAPPDKSDQVSLRGAAHLLGLSHGVLRTLRGLRARSVLGLQPGSGGYARSELLRFQQEVQAGARAAAKAPSLQAISDRPAGCSVESRAAVLLKILRREIPYYRATRPEDCRLDALRVPAAVFREVEAHQPRRSPSLRWAADVLGVTIMEARAIACRDTESICIRRGHQHKISIARFAAFLDGHVSTSSIAREYGLYGKTLLALLRRAGINYRLLKTYLKMARAGTSAVAFVKKDDVVRIKRLILRHLA